MKRNRYGEQRLTLRSVEFKCADDDMVLHKRKRQYDGEVFLYTLYDNELFVEESCHDLRHVLQARDSFLAERKRKKEQCTCPGVACPIHGLPPGSTSVGW